MYVLRKVGYYITLLALLGGTLGVIVLLVLGVGMGSGDNVAGAIIGSIFAVIAVVALFFVAIIILLMIFYKRGIFIPLLFFIVFGFASLRMASSDTPLVFITLGLSIGPFITLIGYFFKKKTDDIPEQLN